MTALPNFLGTIFSRSKRIRQYIKDGVKSSINRFAPGKAAGLPDHGLEVTQVYPNGTNLYEVLRLATTGKLSRLGLNSSTPVASIGTCFAEEFAYFMRKNAFNYIQAEGGVFPASANWGRVYTIPNFLQIVRYSVDPSYPVLLENSDRGWFDPLREPRASYSESKDAANDVLVAHRRASRDAFCSCKILIVTVGQNEAWIDNVTGQVWAHTPPRDILRARRKDFSVVEFSYSENVAALNEAVNILQSENPGLKILFTVSPVASYATFSDTDVVSHSFANKCILRAAVNEVVSARPDELFYFPSFELVLCDNPRNFRADNRHVKYAAVDRIFDLLAKSTALH